MSRAATPLDNAPAKKFFGILKTECIIEPYFRKPGVTFQELNQR